MINWIILNIY